MTQEKLSHFLEASGQTSESPAGLLNRRLPGPVPVVEFQIQQVCDRVGGAAFLKGSWVLLLLL